MLRDRGIAFVSTFFLAGLVLSQTLAAQGPGRAPLGDDSRTNRPSGPLLDPPNGDDDSAASLRAYHERLAAQYGGDREVPLDVKAAYFGWELRRYHITPYHQFYNRAVLAEKPGERPQAFSSRDSSTWNGALLAAVSLEYATTGDRRLLGVVAELVRGLHLFFEVTGQPGLMSRAVAPADGLVLDELKANVYTAPDGTRYYHQDDAAKGGFNQIACGYAALMIHVYPDLPFEIQQLARADIAAMVLHIIDHGYRATARDGRPTTYGDLRPLIGSMSVPFNAQVAYLIVALGYSFPPDDPASSERIRAEFVRLRGTHHVYYEHRLGALVLPQKIGGSPLVKGMNDRFHVTTAAYWALQLEFDHARRHGEAPNGKFVYQLGQTLYWSMDYLHDQHNALLSFLWAGLVNDPAVFDTIVDSHPNTVRGQIEQALVEGVEQLRRYRLDRWVRSGRVIETNRAQWCDMQAPDDNYWKCDPRLIFEPTGQATNAYYAGLDYLYSYWSLRYYRLDKHPTLVKLNSPVLARTPGLAYHDTISTRPQ
ncbi:MAG TPA: hypothetical protein VND64_29130 [Pirellulales bacterium]|nr:hypothetical protein [Pirellulales bacterium]